MILQCWPRDEDNNGKASDSASIVDDPTNYSESDDDGGGISSSLSSDSLAHEETSSGASSLDLNDLENLVERIESLRSKQDISEKASGVIQTSEHLISVRPASQRRGRRPRQVQPQDKYLEQGQSLYVEPTLSSCTVPNPLRTLRADIKDLEEKDDNGHSAVARTRPDRTESAQEFFQSHSLQACSANKTKPYAPSSSKRSQRSKKQMQQQVHTNFKKDSSNSPLLPLACFGMQQEQALHAAARAGSRKNPHHHYKTDMSSPKDANIPLVGVKRLSSVAFENGDSNLEHSTPSLFCSSQHRPSPSSSSLMGSYHQEHWMAKTLIQTFQTLEAIAVAPVMDIHKKSTTKPPRRNVLVEEEDCCLRSHDWEVVPSSSSCDPPYPTEILVPPLHTRSRQSFTISTNTTQSDETRMTIDLNEATRPQTTHARLVAQATPPFLVVFANRAFFQLLGKPGEDENGCKSNRSHSPSVTGGTETGALQEEGPDSVLGCPIESIIDVIRGLEVDHNAPEQQYHGHPSFPQQPTRSAGHRHGNGEEGPSATMAKTTPITSHTSEDAAVPISCGSRGTKGNCKNKNENRKLDSVSLTNRISCQIRVFPVVDRSIPPTTNFLTNNGSDYRHVRCTRRRDYRAACSMPLIMVQVEPTFTGPEAAPPQTKHPNEGHALSHPYPLAQEPKARFLSDRNN